ncbi:hypothetical protein N6H18_10740 [Reichenbachiella agarivorans]|uniref:Uncharacterized protein n=1 Tax=Reichenbachiella agarivorans TaxID=2979464 RepID=A0ABY6CKB5_9BACT|nr:hypothetical protein [Reichenbachiella agarivorans]UXP30829.1 hypothetical protein N6H18_10740 [Reichenbachiella agarivorans]
MSESSYEDSINKIRDYSIEQFDKNIVFIASGALGISFAFIKDIVDLSKAICIQQLMWAWGTFAGVICFSLLGHFISMQAHSWAWANQELSDDAYNKVVRKWSLSIRILNVAMILAIFIGTLLLISFINQNLNET